MRVMQHAPSAREIISVGIVFNVRDGAVRAGGQRFVGVASLQILCSRIIRFQVAIRIVEVVRDAPEGVHLKIL